MRCGGRHCRLAETTFRAQGEGPAANEKGLSDRGDPGGGTGGFWIHRVLVQEGIESHIVDPASIMTSRRRRRAKTDRITAAVVDHRQRQQSACLICVPRIPRPLTQLRSREVRAKCYRYRMANILLFAMVDHIRPASGKSFESAPAGAGLPTKGQGKTAAGRYPKASSRSLVCMEIRHDHAAEGLVRPA